MEKTQEELDSMKKKMISLHEQTIKVAYEYFSALPVGGQRVAAHQFYQNLLYAARS